MENIEKLVAENARLLAENERLRSNCYPRDGVEAIIRERDAYRAQLAESQRRERAAAEDLRKNRARKCDCCVYAGRSERWPCVDCQSPISNYGDGWKWRGPMAGKGEAK